MDQRHNNGAAGDANANVNNNVRSKPTAKKPNVPSKPQHLQGGKGVPLAAPKDVVTPKGWTPQRFTFGGEQKSAVDVTEKPKTNSDSMFTQKWRPVPKVMQKQPSVKKFGHTGIATDKDALTNNSTSKFKSPKKEETQNMTKDESSHSANLQIRAILKNEQDQKSVGSLKRMWSQKTKVSAGSPPQSPQSRPRSKTNEVKRKTSPAVASEQRSPIKEPEKESLSRSTSSSSNSSVRTTSFKDRKVVWHYVTAESPSNNFPADALPSQIDLNETLLTERAKSSKKFNQHILAPRPFRAASVDEGSYAPKSISSPSDDSDISPTKSHTRSKSQRGRSPSPPEDSESSSGEAENPDEKEMRKARKHGVLVTRFDSKGNMFKIDPRTGSVSYVEDSETLNDQPTGEMETTNSHAMLQRMNAIAIEGVTVSESNTDTFTNRNILPTRNEEAPPPLLPRERIDHRSTVPMAPQAVNKMRNSMTPGSMYLGRNQNASYVRTKNYSSDLSPDSAVPPPILPRGQPAEVPTQDYTPMSGSTSDLMTRNSDSRASSVSLNSFLDKSYEPMDPKVDDDDMFNSYSAAIDPPKFNPPKRTESFREYHEIDPDPDVPIHPINAPMVDPGSVPPPPDHEPPALPDGVKARSESQHSITIPDSPPPLPPMNKTKLNYIEVELGTRNITNANKVRGKSQKTNYTEVVVGGGGVGVIKDEGDGKKGKSVKGKLMSMFSNSSKSDGYASEGDAISKHDDERTTDFNKERNRLKRISGRLLRKKKQKSKDNNRHSVEADLSSQGESHGNASVGVYGSATNLSTTSSESTRSLSQVTSSGSSGDGQARPNLYATQGTYPRNTGSDRRRSEDPSRRFPPKLDERSKSAVDLDSPPMSVPKLQGIPDPQHNHSKSAESTPHHAYQAHRTGRDAGSPVISAQRVQSHLHQQNAVRKKSPPPSSRPTSEPTVETDGCHGQSTRPKSTPDLYGTPKSPRLSKSHEMVKVLPLPIIKDQKGENEIEDELLSPNFPSDAPPPPPSLDTLPTRPSPPTQIPPDLPPAPLRELKPDRFKKRVRSGSVDTDYTAADDIPVPHPGNGNAGNALCDDPSPDSHVPSRHAALSASARSKLLDSEPLYQVYRSRTLSHASTKNMKDPLQRSRLKTTASSSAQEQKEEHWQSDLMTDDAGATTLWREVKEVVEDGVGDKLSNAEMKLQQAQFEVVTSQASYMRSLNILIDHFMRDSTIEDPGVLPKKQRKELFSNIVAVREIEQRFLQEIEQHFWDKLYMTKIAQITEKYAKSDFEVYVRYVQNQVYQDRVLTDLQRSNEKFAVELHRLESSPFCNKLPLLSFLLLPMQRVTRLPLLISAIVNNADSAQDKKAYDSAKQALAIVNKLVKKCNEGAKKMQQTEQLAEIARELAFAPKVKTYALVSQSRYVVKKGEMSVIMTLENRKAKAMKLWFFLFSDVLLLAKKKNFLESGTSSKYEVIDWAKRAMLYVNERAVSENEIYLVLLENCVGKRVELALTPVSLNELSRWTNALNPNLNNESEDSIYESWDCPQYVCILPYSAVQPDEVSLDVGDIMRVFKKTGDGWLEGERLRDSEQGWFPAENCEEIADEHVRARNLRNLYQIQPAGGATHD